MTHNCGIRIPCSQYSSAVAGHQGSFLSQDWVKGRPATGKSGPRGILARGGIAEMRFISDHICNNNRFKRNQSRHYRLGRNPSSVLTI